ncbi:MAG: SRPBCC family protein [Anaerolineales bacterium]
MPKISKSITIDVPVENVFSYMAKLTNLPKIWTNLKTVREVRCHIGIITGYEWTYYIEGIPFEGEAIISESIPNRRIVIKNKEVIPSSFVLSFQSLDGGTHLSVEVDYILPDELLEKHDEPSLAKKIEFGAEEVLKNLKTKMEDRSSPLDL